VSQGNTVEEAYANLECADESWIEACQSRGQEIPEPSSSLGFSGKIALRLPRSIHKQAAKMAERDRSSLNTYIVSAVSAKVGVEDFSDLLAQRLEQQLMATVSNLAQAAYNLYQDYLASQTSAKRVRGIGQITSIARVPIESTASNTETTANIGGR
jgi:predicted HicB family RNase H-like nuclease